MRHLLALAVLLVGGLLAFRAMPAAGRDDGSAGETVRSEYSFQAELNLSSDICGHEPYIWGANHPPPHNMKLITRPCQRRPAR
jgi:hypothetical protein